MDSPPLGQSFRGGFETAIKRKGPDVTHYEVMSHIVGRERAAQPVIREVDPLAKARGVIDALRKRVGAQEGKIGGLALHGDFTCVVVRVGNVGSETVVRAEVRSECVARPDDLGSIRQRVSRLFTIWPASGSGAHCVELQ